MRKLIGISLLLVLFSLAAVAQDYPKAEVFGGYQYTRLDGGVNANGWNGAFTGNLNRWFGVAGDFSGAYKTQSGASLRAYTYTFGPVVSMHKGGFISPFAHVLLGGFHGSVGFGGFSGSTNGFAMMVGGGVDVKVAPRIAVRAVQVDWLSLRAGGATDNNNARISTGFVFHL